MTDEILTNHASPPLHRLSKRLAHRRDTILGQADNVENRIVAEGSGYRGGIVAFML
jgi:hypothetical protein